MNPLPYILAPILLLPVAVTPGHLPAGVAGTQGDKASLVEQAQPRPVTAGPDDSFPYNWLAQAWQPRPADQVSIEQHIVIRIAPRARINADPRVTTFADVDERPAGPRFEERKMSKCVPIDGLAGVGAQFARGDKLIIFLRDNRVVSAGLDKGCSARDFYSGFYVARSADGMLCSGRDKLQSRNGASCKLGKMHQIVAVGE